MKIQIPFLITLFVFSTLQAMAYAESRPNVLVLFMDDQRTDTIAALGNPHIQTPNLDRLVHRGLSFRRAYMQGGQNGATCVPSRAMLLSGRTLFRIDEKLMRDATWPEAFAGEGYSTFISGKWHNGEASLAKCFQESRSIFAGGMTNPLEAKLQDVVDGKLANDRISKRHACAIFVDEAVSFIERKHEKPFFCYVPFDGPHDPHIVPEEFPIRYSAESIPLPKNFLPFHPWDNGDMELRDEKLLPWPRPEIEVRQMLADYYRYISYLDEQIGRLLDVLEHSPYASNTLIVFAADSGVARGSHGLIGKQNLYEHSIRVPLIFAGPGVPQDAKTDALCYLLDVLPTLGKLCSVDGPMTSDGKELTSVLKRPDTSVRTELVFGYRSFQRAIRDNRWKLIRYTLINKTQLFDIEADPLELNNLADDSRYAETVERLMKKLEEQLRRDGDDLPLTSSNPKPADWMPTKPNR